MTNTNPDLENYEKLRLIRRGSSGEVYEVKDKKKGGIYAAKIFFYLTDSSSIEVYKQKNEIDIISKLNFPSIIKHIKVSQRDFTNKNKPVIITEYYPNGTLDQLLCLSEKNKPPLEWTDTKKLIIIFGIASAMKYLHSKSIIHGNLKPSNILLDANYYPKIFDFYNSFDEKNSSKFPISSNNQSPIYTASEYYWENEITKSGDVFSFGMIVYEIISNKKPFLNEQPFMIQQKIANGERPDFNEKINDSFKELIESCWCDNPSERLSFENIVTQLKENNDFCEKSINRDEFNQYVDSFKRKRISPKKFIPDKIQVVTSIPT